MEIFIYIIVVNLIGLLLMFVDKGRAIKNQWRVSENTLFMISIIGGSIGVLSGMYLCRHKTKHASFVYGIPAIILLQLFAIGYILTNLI